MATQSLLSVVLGLNSSQFTKGLTQAQNKLRKTAGRMQSVGRGMSLGVSAPLVAIGASAFKVSADFELAMKKVKAISGSTGKDFELLEKSAKDLGSSTVFSASEVAGLQLELAKLGVNAKGIEASTGSILGLAQAFGTELAPTAEAVQQTINQFGLEASEAGRVSDVMAKAFGSSALDLEKFSGSMANAGILSSQFGFSLEETTSLLGVLANNGLSGADAGTKLKMAFSQLASEGVDVKKTFTAIINGSMDYSQAIKVLGKRSAILQPLFGKNLEDLNDLQKELLNAGGTALDMSKDMDDTAKGGIAGMKSAIEGAQIALGDALAPTIMVIVNDLKSLAQSFQRLNPSTQETIVKVGLFATALGPLVFAIGSIIKAVQGATIAVRAFTASLLTNPYTALAVAVLAIGTALFTMTSASANAMQSTSDFTEILEIQNSTLKESVKQLSARSALIRSSFSGGGVQTVQDIKDQIRALETELQNLSPEALEKLLDTQIELSRNTLKASQAGITPAFDTSTGKINQEIARNNTAIIADLAGVNITPAIQDILSSLDPFGISDNTLKDDFDQVVEIINTQIDGLEKDLETREGDIESSLEIIFKDDTDKDQLNKPKETLDTVLAGLEKQIQDIGKLEVLFGENLDSEKFTALEGAIKKIVTAEFDIPDEKLQSLITRMNQFKEETDNVLTPIDSLKETFKELEISQSLGIVSELETATAMINALETALRESILADPNFINTEQFKELSGVLENLRGEINSTKVTQDTLNESFDVGATVGNAMGQIVSAGFDSMTNSGESFGESIKKIFLNILKGALSTAIANAITSAFSPASPDNIATGGASAPIKAGKLTAIVTSLFASIPKFAQGGMTLGPTLAMIGDNPSGREAVIPFEKMGSFLQMAGVGSSNVNVTGKIKGQDIVLSQERAMRNRGR